MIQKVSSSDTIHSFTLKTEKSALQICIYSFRQMIQKVSRSYNIYSFTLKIGKVNTPNIFFYSFTQKNQTLFAYILIIHFYTYDLKR